MVFNCVLESKELLDMQVNSTKRQVKMVHKAADKLDKKDFMKGMAKMAIVFDMQQQLTWLKRN